MKSKLSCLSIKGQKKEVLFHENDISAQEAFTRKGSRIQSENEYEGWKKGFSGQTCKGKKSIVRLGHRNVTFLFMRRGDRRPAGLTDSPRAAEKGRKIDAVF